MALQFVNQHGTYLTMLNQHIPAATYSNGSVFGSTFPVRYDPVLSSLMYNTNFSIGEYRVEELLGCYPMHGSDELVEFSTPVENYAYDSNLDSKKYGGLFGNFSLFFRTLSGVGAHFNPVNEHSARHRQLSGRVRPLTQKVDMLPNPIVPGPWYFLSPPDCSYLGMPSGWARMPLDGSRDDMCTVRGDPNADYADFDFFPIRSQLDTYDPSGFNPGIAVRDILNAWLNLQGLSGYTLPGTWVGRYGCFVNLTNFSYTVTGSTIDVYYTMLWDLTSYVALGDSIHLTLSGGIDLPSADHMFGSTIAGYYEKYPTTGSLHIRYEDTLISGFGPNLATHLQGRTFGNTYVLLDKDIPSDFYPATRPYRSGSSSLVRSSLNLLINRIDYFTPAVEDKASEIRAASYISTSDAFGTMSESVRNDLFQSLQKMGEISALLPEVSHILSAVEALRGGNYAGSLSEILSFIANTHLQLSFTWRANYQLLTETAGKMESVLHSLERLSGKQPVIGRGSYSYTFPSGTFGRQDSHLSVHTKIVADAAQGALRAVLGVQALGLLPAPSVLWDLTPYSFAVNWFSGVGNRIRDLEGLTLLTLMGIRCLVHGYYIYSDFTPEEMQYYGIEAVSSDPEDYPRMGYYAREVSAIVPSPRDSEFDFRMPMRAPFWLTPVSLILQQLL